jgi:hypothetical protein
MRPASPNLLDPNLPTADSCRRLTARVLAIKQILIDSYHLQGVPAALVREAIAAAEAQAWQVGFPHLFLPDLADEILRQLRQKGGLIHPDYAQAA